MKNNVVQMIGGIGNQMFQYSLFRRFLEMGVDVKYEHMRTVQYHNGFVLKKVFNIIERPIVDLKEADVLERFQENTWPDFNQDVLEKRDTYFCGNWQNIKYFPDPNTLLTEFSFKQELDKQNQRVLDDIQDSESVSLHIRRGDYTTMSNYFFQADQINYYGPAINHILKNVKNPKFFIFSDDIEWAQQNTFIKARFISWNTGFDSWKDLRLMSNCKHNITANSTFSWWGAWLNQNPDKIVITPKRWFLDLTIDSNKITLNEWVKI